MRLTLIHEPQIFRPNFLFHTHWLPKVFRKRFVSLLFSFFWLACFSDTKTGHSSIMFSRRRYWRGLQIKFVHFFYQPSNQKSCQMVWVSLLNVTSDSGKHHFPIEHSYIRVSIRALEPVWRPLEYRLRNLATVTQSQVRSQDLLQRDVFVLRCSSGRH